MNQRIAFLLCAQLLGTRVCLNLSAAPDSAIAPNTRLSEFDFTQPGVVQEWQAQHDISGIRHTPEGLEVTLNGADPYFAGPARDYPKDTTLWLHLRLKSESGGSCQVFYFQQNATEQRSVRFNVPAGHWRDIRVKLPSLGPGYRFRIDPPGTDGKTVLASLQVTAAIPLAAPSWPAVVRPNLDAKSPSIQSGTLKLAHAPNSIGSFELSVQGKPMAIGHGRLAIGYVQHSQARWFNVGGQATNKFELQRQPAAIVTTVTATDPDGAYWKFTQRFALSKIADAIEVESTVQVDQDRLVIFLPMLAVLPGVGTFGQLKGQGLFAGLEYLGDEPSSSEADVTGPAAQRLVPDTLKITFPLMAIQAEDRYVGVVWEMQPHFSALFDSPDRTFGSGAHAMAILFPGSNGENREDGHLLPHDGTRLAASQPLVLRATLVGGLGRSVIPAVQKYVQLRGLPALPQSPSLGEYVSLAAGGWLDSKGREGNRFRHAVWQGFGAQPAADAAFYMDWLAERTTDSALAQRLMQTARDALTQVRPEDYYSTLVSHVRLPAAPLVYGYVAENARHAAATAKGLLSRFEPDGRVLYRKSPNGPDYGKTHFAPDANGLTAQVVESLLQAAVFSGDRELIDSALKRLRALDRFRNDVPRGAQTWEVPLHTPDILASAHLVRAYTLGFELTGERELLEEARYWAWTGLPFVYLIDPTDKPIGRYTTPPVYGATGWVAPVWMGLPVQWCGLVYADALYRLVRHDAQGPWKQVADGITVAGIQVTWPTRDKERLGLLPDVFHLRDQFRDGPAINPGTVQACAARWFGPGPMCDFLVVRERGWWVHAPGEISEPTLLPNGVQLTVSPWLSKPCFVLVNGFQKPPRVTLNDQPTKLAMPHAFSEGRLILQIRGKSIVDILAAP